MKNLFFILVAFCSFSTAQAQTDTLLHMNLTPVDVHSARVWKNDTLAYRYNQLRHNIQVVLPYVNQGSSMYREMNARLAQSDMSRSERKAYLKNKEEEIRAALEDKVLKLNTTQGVLLMKLMARQTGENLYQMVGDLKNPFTAIKWQTWARLNGYNLNRHYNPADEPDMEQIMENLGYPLPAAYAAMLPDQN